MYSEGDFFNSLYVGAKRPQKWGKTPTVGALPRVLVRLALGMGQKGPNYNFLSHPLIFLNAFAFSALFLSLSVCDILQPAWASILSICSELSLAPTERELEFLVVCCPALPSVCVVGYFTLCGISYRWFDCRLSCRLLIIVTISMDRYNRIHLKLLFLLWLKALESWKFNFSKWAL